MIFSVGTDGSEIVRVRSTWAPRELDVEKYIVSGPNVGDGLLNESILGEELLLLSNQVLTADKKRADIVALDRRGSSVFIELKRDEAAAGVETQVLQYLASFAPVKGHEFLRLFKRPQALEERVRGFLGDLPFDEVNRRQRIILVARSFDRTLFSMGKWFGANGIAFRCIAYSPFEVHGERFLSFSVQFDHSTSEAFPLSFGSSAREPATFWHNIGAADQDWWTYLIAQGLIPASFDNQPGDAGERLLKSYVRGDRLIAYAAGFGAVGWGRIEQPRYALADAGTDADRMHGELRHRLRIKWERVADRLDDGIPPAEIRALGLYHPVSTSVSIEEEKADVLVSIMNQRFRSPGGR